jgi:large repetitive protein
MDGSRLPLKPFLTGEGAWKMLNKRRVSLFLSFLIVLQLLMPIINTFASEIVGVPKNLTIQKQNINDISLKWDPVYGANGYKIYKINAGQNELLAESSSASWYGLKVKAGTYNLAVTAVKGTYESALSSVVTIDIVYPELVAPKVYTPTIVNGNDILLQWDKVQYGTNYNIYQTINGQKQLVATTNLSNYTFVKMAQGEYLFEIKAYSDRFGESLHGTEVKAAIIYPKIESPTQLTSTIVNGNDLLLQWKAQVYSTNYNIYKVVDGQRELVDKTNRTDYFFSRLQEGDYTFEITTVNDRFGESEQGTNVNVSIIYPKIDSPLELTSTIVQGNDVLLQWKAAKYAVNYNIYQIVSDQRILVDKTSRTDYYLSRLQEGNYVYEITTENDRFGESNPGSQTEFSIVHPTIQPPASLTSTLYRGTDVYLEWKAASYATEYNIYRVVEGKKEFIKSTSGTNLYLPELKNEEYVFAVSTVSNRFGESKEYAQTSIFVGIPIMKAPVVYLQQDKNYASINWDSVKYAESYKIYELVNGTAIPIGMSATNSYTLEDLSNGLHEFVVTSLNESYGESTFSNKVYATVNPELEAPDANNPSVEGDEVRLTWSPVLGAQSYNVYEVIGNELVLVEQTSETNLTIKNLDSGNYEFRIVPVSPEGVEGENYSTVVVEAEQFDTTPPQTVANETEEWVQEEYKVELTATDGQSGVAKTFYSINGSPYKEGTTFTVNEDGIHVVSFYSVDNAGNEEAPKSTVIKVDNTPPLTVSDVTENWSNDVVTVNLTATDDLSGVAKTFYSFNGTDFVEGTSFTVNKEGIQQVYFYSVDNAGNVESTKTAEVKIDKTAPETVSDVTDKWNKGEVAVYLTATDNLSGVDKTFYSLNGIDFEEGTSFKVNEQGVKTVYFYSVDIAGNVEEVKTAQVKIDKTAPETVSDVIGQWNNGDVTVNLTATDNLSGVAKTYYSLNGTDFLEGTSFTVYEEGTKTVYFYSVDNAGNVEEVKTAQVKIDKTAPETVSDVTDKWNKGEVTVNLTATDNLSGVDKTFYSLNGTDFVEVTSFTVNEEGVKTVYFYSVDNAGNVEEVKTAEVKIDKTAPTASWNLDEEYALGVSLPLDYQASDELSGIAEESVTVNGQVYQKGDSVKLDQPGTYNIVVKVIDNAGNSTTIEKTFVVYIPGTLVVNPGVIKANTGDFTVKITLPTGFNTNQIDLSTATLNGVSAKSGTNGLVQQAKTGQFKFNRDDFKWSKGKVLVEFRVLVNGQLVVGSTFVEVK